MSSQGEGAKRGGAFQEQVRQAAMAQYQAPPMAGELYARVVWIHAYSYRPNAQSPDIDNIVKPLLDALEGVAFLEDHSIVRCTCSRHRIQDLVVPPPSNTGLPVWWYDKLYSLMASFDSPDIVHLEVAPSSSRDLVVGPVDGVAINDIDGII